MSILLSNDNPGMIIERSCPEFYVLRKNHKDFTVLGV